MRYEIINFDVVGAVCSIGLRDRKCDRFPDHVAWQEYRVTHETPTGVFVDAPKRCLGALMDAGRRPKTETERASLKRADASLRRTARKTGLIPKHCRVKIKHIRTGYYAIYRLYDYYPLFGLKEVQQSI